MAQFAALTAELGRLALDLANRAHAEGRGDEADRFIHLAFTIFEEAYLSAPALQVGAEGMAQPRA